MAEFHFLRPYWLMTQFIKVCHPRLARRQPRLINGSLDPLGDSRRGDQLIDSAVTIVEDIQLTSGVLTKRTDNHAEDTRSAAGYY